jgi:simple sugar transport system permease protein
MDGFAPGFGFDGVIAALLANGNPLRYDRHRSLLRRAQERFAPARVDTTASREIITVVRP